jgi:type VI secretion system secreted protein Hcp
MGFPGAPGAQGLPGRDGRDGTVSVTGSPAAAETACNATITGDIFAKIDGIPGSSTNAKHQGENALTAFGWGGIVNAISNPSSGAGSGKAQIGPVCFVKALDAGTSGLIQTAASGKHIQEITFSIDRNSTKETSALKLKLSDVVISSYKTGTAGDLPGDEVVMNFARAEITSCPLTITGAAACSTVTVDSADSKF